MISQTSLRYMAGAVLPRTTVKGQAARTAYLAHSSHDRKLALGLQSYLVHHGWRLDLTWDDFAYGAGPAGRIAQAKKRMIANCDWFLYLATQQGELDHWCQWELTFAAGVKSGGRVVVIPTSSGDKRFGERHLQLHRFIWGDGGGVRLCQPGSRDGQRLDMIEAGE